MCALLVKNIYKPQRFNERAFWEEITFTMSDFAKMVKEEFEKTTQTWKHKPKFVILEDQGGNKELSILVGTDDEIYRYVDKGTREHIIVPKGEGYPLRFQRGYKAKTIPGVIGSQAGGPFGDYRHAYFVIHPGSEPRNFDLIIEETMQPKYKTALENAMRRARKACGHAA